MYDIGNRALTSRPINMYIDPARIRTVIGGFKVLSATLTPQDLSVFYFQYFPLLKLFSTVFFIV